MNKLLHYLVKSFVPKSLIGQKASLEYRKCNFLLWSCLIIIFNGCVFLPFYFVFFEFNTLFQAVLISFISVLLIPLYIKRNGNLETAGTMVILNTFVMLFTSLLHGEPYPNPSLAWFTLLPIASAFLINGNAAWWAALAAIISNYALYEFSKSGVTAPLVENSVYPVEFNIIKYTLIYLSSALVAKIFVKSWEDINHQKSTILIEKHQLNIDLINATNSAKKENKIRALFTASVGHEIKNPLNGIIGMIDLLQKTSLDEKQTKFVAIMNTTSGALVNIIRDLMDLTRIEEGKIEIEEIPFGLNNLLKDIVGLYRSRCDQKGIQFRVIQKDNITSRLLGDPTRLRQIVTNLLENSIKFTDKGFVEFSASIKSESKRNVLLEIIIRDTGIGMRKESIDTLFTPFTQGEVGIEKKYGGSGLGMAIVKELVELMNGSIDVHSVYQEGSVFTLQIPLRRKPSEDD